MSGRAGSIEQSPGQQPADALVHPQHERERTEAPTRGGLGQQPVLPLAAAGHQFGPHFAGNLAGQSTALLVNRVLNLPHARQRFVEADAARVERVGRQIEEVRPADAGARRAGHLTREQIEQFGKLAPRLQTGLGIIQRPQRIDAEDVPGIAFWSPLPLGEG